MCNQGPLGGIAFCVSIAIIVFGVGYGTPDWVSTDDGNYGLWQICVNTTGENNTFSIVCHSSISGEYKVTDCEYSLL